MNHGKTPAVVQKSHGEFSVEEPSGRPTYGANQTNTLDFALEGNMSLKRWT
jgi:hypothetical protein